MQRDIVGGNTPPVQVDMGANPNLSMQPFPQAASVQTQEGAAQWGWRVVLAAFLNTLDSPATRREYQRDIETALAVLGDLHALTAVALTEYRERCLARLARVAANHLAPASVVRHLAAVRSFLRFARLTGQLRLPDEVIRFSLKSPKAKVLKPYQVLSAAEQMQLVAAASGKPRDRVLLLLVIATGVRASEVCALQVGDLVIDEEGDLLIHIRQGKGRQDRIIPLARDVARELRNLLAQRKLKIGRERDKSAHVFASRQGAGQMTTARLRQIVAGYLRQSDLQDKPISPHSLRHSAAITWLRSGASVVAVQKLLGHASLSTTQKYVDHLGLRDLKKVVNRPATASRSRANQA